MNFEVFMARRYLSTRHKPFFISFLVLISLLGVTTGVFFLIFVQAVMNGFEADFYKKVTGFKAPLVATTLGDQDLEALIHQVGDARITGVEPFVEGEAVAQAETGETVGVKVRGVLGRVLRERFNKYYFSETFTNTSLLAGEDLAAALQVHPDFFDTIRLIYPLGSVSPTGEMIPNIRSFNLSGVYRAGFYEYDSKYVLIPYIQALRLFGEHARKGVEIWVKPDSAVEDVKSLLAKKLPSNGIELKSWRDQNPKLFAALKLERIGMFVLLSVLLLIASFNIFGLISLNVLEKVRDMAIFRAMGLSQDRVRRIFQLQAVVIGLLGMVLGGGLGLVMNLILEKYPIHLPPSYYLEYLPLKMEFLEVATIFLLAPAIAFLASLYPAHEATKYLPVEVLRYE